MSRVILNKKTLNEGALFSINKKNKMFIKLAKTFFTISQEAAKHLEISNGGYVEFYIEDSKRFYIRKCKSSIGFKAAKQEEGKHFLRVTSKDIIEYLSKSHNSKYIELRKHQYNETVLRLDLSNLETKKPTAITAG